MINIFIDFLFGVDKCVGYVIIYYIRGWGFYLNKCLGESILWIFFIVCRCVCWGYEWGIFGGECKCYCVCVLWG